MYRGLFIILAAAVFLGACGHTDQGSSGNDHRLKIVATFYPMYDFAKEVAGDQADVEVIIPKGTEPHDYRPTPKTVAKIIDADVFIYNHEQLETWVPKVLHAIDPEKVKVVKASKGIKLKQTPSAFTVGHVTEEEGALDPHVWLSPVLAKKEVENIRDALIQADPDHKSDYEANAASFLKKLDALDKRYKQAFQGAENRTFVTSHAAFGYLAKTYHLNQVAIAGLSSELEPSPRRLAELKSFIDRRNIQVIYFEELASPEIAKTLAHETGAATAVLNPIEGLTKSEQAAGEDYISLMKENLKALKKTIH